MRFRKPPKRLHKQSNIHQYKKLRTPMVRQQSLCRNRAKPRILISSLSALTPQNATPIHQRNAPLRAQFPMVFLRQ